MANLTNLTQHSAAQVVTRDSAGRTQFCVAVKAVFIWNRRGEIEAAPPEPLLQSDEYAGEPASTGLLRAAEIGAPKPRVDVLLSGALTFPVPVDAVDVTLAVGGRIEKTVHVVGDRFWIPGVIAEAVPSPAQPTQRVPIDWARSAGGTDREDPSCSDPRNPAGSGVARKAANLLGQRAPNFEEPGKSIGAWNKRPSPQGFGPLAPHWQPRIEFAGTYDDRWQNDRNPLPPEDFDPRFFNVAPLDQQLDTFVPDEEVRLVYAGRVVKDTFRLPPLSVPVTFVTNHEFVEDEAVVDTVIIEPETSRLSLIARAAFVPSPTLLAMRETVVGELSSGRRRAIATGRKYLGRSAEPRRRS